MPALKVRLRARESFFGLNFIANPREIWSLKCVPLVACGGIRDSLSASAFDITAREIPTATKLRGSYNGLAQIVANLQTMPIRRAQRPDLPDIAVTGTGVRAARLQSLRRKRALASVLAAGGR